MESSVWQYIERHRLLTEGQTVGAAVSGGADSMALLVCLCALSRTHGFKVTALHYEHGIRGDESLRDANFVKEFCREHAIPLILERGDVPGLAREKRIGLELAARQAREEFFRRVLNTGKVQAVATAHHAGDQAESVLMHVLRGCGTDGLRGIAPQKEGIIRPFLCVSRAQILRYLKDANVAWMEDSTNSDENLTRNYVRRKLLPAIACNLNPAAEKALCRLAACADEDADYLNWCAEQAFAVCLEDKTATALRLRRMELAKHHPAVAVRVVRRALALLGRASDVERIHLKKVLAAADAATGLRLDLGGGLQMRTEYGSLVLEKKTPEAEVFCVPVEQEGRTQLPNGASLFLEPCEHRLSDTRNGFREYADADKLERNLVIRTRLPGDTLIPLNGPGRKKLKDYFIDRKLPRPVRDSIPVLADGSNVLWIVGEMLSQDIRVDADTRRVVRLTYEPAARENA